MNFDLENKKWLKFKLDDIFLIEHCKCSNVSSLNAGDFPYVGATNRNNGILSYVKFVEKFITRGNCIAFICDGEGSVGLSIYRKSDFIGSTTVKVGRNEFINEYTGQFITTIADKVRGKYNFGFKRNEEHLKNEVLILPVDSNNKPDYPFMEAYMRQKEQEKLDRCKHFISKRILELQNYKNTDNLDSKEWREFEIGKLFIMSPGKSKGLNHLVKVNNGTNYLGATNLNNGVLCQVQKDEKLIHKGNAIAFIRNGEGSMGYSIYKAEDFIATSDISVGYSKFINRYTGKFITTIADKVRGKYNFGYKRSDKRLKKEKIMLPVNRLNNPDFEFMENYIKHLEYKKLNKYVNYKDIF